MIFTFIFPRIDLSSFNISIFSVNPNVLINVTFKITLRIIVIDVFKLSL